MRTLLLGLEGTGARPPRVRCVSRGPGGSTWRADYDDTVVMGLESARPEGEVFSWVHGVISSSHGLSVLPDVLVRSSLLDEIALATSTDDFLSKVLGRVQESDTVACRDFIPLTVIVCRRVIPGWSVRRQV